MLVDIIQVCDMKKLLKYKLFHKGLIHDHAMPILSNISDIGYIYTIKTKQNCMSKTVIMSDIPCPAMLLPIVQAEKGPRGFKLDQMGPSVKTDHQTLRNFLSQFIIICSLTLAH